MSFVTLVQITCDTDACKAAHWADSTTEAWREAHADGWERDGEQHRCRAHAPVRQRVETIRDLAAKGWTDGRIGARIGLSRGGVQGLRQRHGIPGQREGRPSRRPVGVTS